jgi:hypothetical protein
MQSGLGLIAFLRRSESINDAKIVVIVIVFLLVLLLWAAHEAGLCLLLRELSGGDEPEIMFRVLEITLRHHRISGRMGVPCKLKILLRNMMGGPAYLYVWSI